MGSRDDLLLSGADLISPAGCAALGDPRAGPKGRLFGGNSSCAATAIFRARASA